MNNLALIQHHFVLRHDEVHRRLSDGTLKRVKCLEQGVLTAMVDRRKYKVPDIAWALHYGHAPICPVHVLDGDPFNMSVDNLMPVRTKRLRFYHKETAKGFVHNLAKGVAFPSLIDCRYDWARCARNHYSGDLVFVLAMGEQREALKGPDQYRPPVREPNGVRSRMLRPQSPTPVAGRMLHFHRGTWVSVPEPIHPSDDFMNRCAAVLDGAVAMRFDSELEQCVPVWGPTRGARADLEFIHVQLEAKGTAT